MAEGDWNDGGRGKLNREKDRENRRGDYYEVFLGKRPMSGCQVMEHT